MVMRGRRCMLSAPDPAHSDFGSRAPARRRARPGSGRLSWRGAERPAASEAGAASRATAANPGDEETAATRSSTSIASASLSVRRSAAEGDEPRSARISAGIGLQVSVTPAPAGSRSPPAAEHAPNRDAAHRHVDDRGACPAPPGGAGLVAEHRRAAVGSAIRAGDVARERQRRLPRSANQPSRRVGKQPSMMPSRCWAGRPPRPPVGECESSQPRPAQRNRRWPGRAAWVDPVLAREPCPRPRRAARRRRSGRRSSPRLAHRSRGRRRRRSSSRRTRPRPTQAGPPADDAPHLAGRRRTGGRRVGPRPPRTSRSGLFARLRDSISRSRRPWPAAAVAVLDLSR